MACDRLNYFDLKDAKRLRTFDKEDYILKGTIAVNVDNGDVEKLADVYYRVRTVVGENRQIIAKRKNKLDELKRVKSNQKYVKKLN